MYPGGEVAALEKAGSESKPEEAERQQWKPQLLLKMLLPHQWLLLLSLLGPKYLSLLAKRKNLLLLKPLLLMNPFRLKLQLLLLQ